MPRPAVIRLTSPGRMAAALPRLSRCMISPSNRNVTVASPICGCGRTSMPWPVRNSTGPKWSKKMKGPTMRRLTWGSARRTVKPPRSTLRGTITRSMASPAAASPGAGSGTGEKLIVTLRYTRPWFPSRSSRKHASVKMRLFDVKRLGAGRLAGGVERDLLHPRLGLPQQLLAAALEELAAFIDGDRFLQRNLAFLQPLDDRLELIDRPLEGQLR